MNLKKIVLGAALMLSMAFVAQEKGDFNGFAGLSYPLTSGSDLGITAGVEYVFAENFSAAPSFTYYTTSGITNTQINLDARYYLGDENFNWFLTAGFSRQTHANSGISVSDNSVSDNGVGIGVGALFSLTEAIEVLSVVKYNSIGSGAVIPFVGVNIGF